MSNNEDSGPILEVSVEERSALKRLAAGATPHSQRAGALLALADGADLAGAGITADLTVNQVRYWLGRFRAGRLDVFPAELLATTANETAADGAPPMLAAPQAAPLIAAPEIAGALPDEVPGSTEAAAAAAGASAVVLSKKKKKGKKKGKKTAKAKKAKETGKKKKSKKAKKSESKKKNKKKPKKSKKDKKKKK